MSERCGCSREGDATVFGSVHECSKDPDLRYGQHRTLPKLVPSSWFVVPPTSEGVAADNLQQRLDEPRYLETLDESERTGH